MSIKSPSDIQETVERQEKFLQWLADVWRRKNWVRVLLIMGALALALNPITLSPIVGPFNLKLPTWYTLIWGLVVAVVFISAFVVALRTTRPSVHRPPPPGGARKGLRPFELVDAELFARLEREESLQECLAGVTAGGFRFGIICGGSGCGKSSFLRAGLWPRLLKNKHRCAYVEFTHLNPLERIRQALIDQGHLPKELAEQGDFLALVEAVGQSATEPVVLIFDQFEQFFVHNKSKSSRKDFVQDLATWYKKNTSLPVKILVSIRGDFADRLIELQKAMGYSLGPQESFRLEGFDPEQATAIFRVIADTEGIKFDESFVKEMVTDELASREDGLVSPVNIQILAWMVAVQPVGERAFNRITYQRLGGVEGLLERFLKRTLSARETESRRQAAIKVLLALTDLERNTRAGAYKLDDLKEKIGGTVAAGDVEEAVKWLARSDVRLITLSERKGAGVYELAHERLIPALCRVAGQELSETDRANQLLDRRVNEWLGNGRASRYLLTLRELRLIKRHQPYLTWGTQRSQKEALLTRSRRRRNFRIGASSFVLLVAIAISGWWLSPWGQIWQVKRDVAKLSNSITDTAALEEAALASVKVRDFEQAHQTVDRVHGILDRMSVLVKVSKEYVQMGEKQRAIKTTEYALQWKIAFFFNLSELDASKYSSVLIDAAEVYALAGEKDLAVSALQEARVALESQYFTGAAGEKGAIFTRIGLTYIKLGQKEKAADILLKAEETIRNADSVGNSAILEYARRSGLLELAEAYGQLSDKDKAITIARQAIRHGKWNSQVLMSVAAVYVRYGDKKEFADFLQKAEQATQQSDLFDKVIALTNIAAGYAKLDETEKASEILLKAEQAAGGWVEPSEEGDSYERGRLVDAWLQIAEIYALLSRKDKAASALNQAADRVEKLSSSFWDYDQGFSVLRAYIQVGLNTKDPQFLAQAVELSEKLPDVRRMGQRRTITYYQKGFVRTFILLDVVDAYFKLGDKEKAADVLKLAERISVDMSGSADEEAHALLRIAKSYIKLNENERATVALSEAELFIGNVDAGNKAVIVLSMADAYAKLAYWGRARRAAENTGLNDTDQVKTLSRILRIWANSDRSETIDDDAEKTLIDMGPMQIREIERVLTRP